MSHEEEGVYQKLLVAIDLVEDSAKQVLTAAQAFFGADVEVSVLHVVEPQYVQYSFDPTFTGSLVKSLEREAMESAQRRVAELTTGFEVDEERQHVVMGHAASVIRDFARNENVSLIVIGTHGRRGWQRLLGNTANSVLHGAPADVLVVRIQPDEE